MLSVLHADGDKDVRESDATFLASRGLDVHTADGGVDCVQKLRRFVPNLLILDLELPWGGGDGVLAIMQNESQLRRIPVVMTCAGAAVDTQTHRTSPPIVRSLVKPYRSDELWETVAGPRISALVAKTEHRGESTADNARRQDDLITILEQRIRTHTSRRVLNLRVQRIDGDIHVQCLVRSYHIKQLVLVAAMKSLVGSGIEAHFNVLVE